MTIRSGGRPRDNRSTQQAHPADESKFPKPWEADPRRPQANGNGGKGNGKGYG
jgi:hypothetical protein